MTDKINDKCGASGIRVEALCRVGEKKTALVNRLEHCCKACDGAARDMYLNGDLNVWTRMKCVFLAWKGADIIGVLTVFTPDGEYAEINAMVHPDFRRQGIAGKLLAAAKEELSGYGVKKLIVSADPENSAGVAVLKHIHAKPLKSEYLMELTEKPEAQKSCVTVKLCDSEDGFESYDALVNGELIGTAAMSVGKRRNCIYDVEIFEEYRGNGYGKAFIRELTNRMEQGGSMVLQVTSENERACHIYRQLGFKVIDQIDFYSIS